MEPLVSICCLAYNHVSYIRQCLEGFLMQKVNFLFEILIHDDASTDGTVEIIREYESKYPEIIKPIYQIENQYSKGVLINATYQYPRVRGKYIALCESDDYWIDPLKLQKQVDIMESNSEFAVCSHAYIEQYADRSIRRNYTLIAKMLRLQKKNILGEDVYIYTKNDNLKFWLTQPLTVLFRSELLNKIPCEQFVYFRDVHMFYYLLSYGNGAFLNYYGGIYNKHATGVHSTLSTKQALHVQLDIYKELYTANPHDSFLEKIYIRTSVLLMMASRKSFMNSMIFLFRTHLSITTKVNCLFFSIAFSLKHLFVDRKGALFIEPIKDNK
jgi:glycosyltransferase involved in cell wall biosynthesis